MGTGPAAWQAGRVTTLRWERAPELRRPLVVLALQGLFDVGNAATGAAGHLCAELPSTRIATIDSEEFFDFQQERPHVAVDDDGVREISWPDTRAHAIVLPDAPRDVVVIDGVEPHLAWRTWTDLVGELCSGLGADLVVTLGATAAGVPHTRPPEVVGSTTDASLAARLGLGRPSYQGPTGVAGVLHERLDRGPVPAISLRVGVPHYLGTNENPPATRALLQRLEQVTGLATRFTALDDEIAEWRRRVDAAVESDDDARVYVAQLEREADRRLEELPSGDDLAAQLEDWLRERREE